MVTADRYHIVGITFFFCAALLQRSHGRTGEPGGKLVDRSHAEGAGYGQGNELLKLCLKIARRFNASKSIPR